MKLAEVFIQIKECKQLGNPASRYPIITSTVCYSIFTKLLTKHAINDYKLILNFQTTLLLCLIVKVVSVFSNLLVRNGSFVLCSPQTNKRNRSVLFVS